MKMIKFFTTTLFLLVISAALALGNEEFFGDWTGELATPQGNLPLIVTIMEDETGALGEYFDIPETFAPSALKLVADWINARF